MKNVIVKNRVNVSVVVGNRIMNKLFNYVKLFSLTLFLAVLSFHCDDTREPDETPQELIQMWLDGNEIPVYDYYESVTTYGVKTLTDSGDVKKVFVIHFQKDGGRISPEKEHYALIMYDIDAINNDDLIDEGSYVNPASQSTKGVTLEIVGLSDYTSNAQGAITRNEDNVVDGVVEGTFYNPYSETLQNGLLLFENVTIGTDTANTFYSEFY